METINFSYNWNNKLDCQAFTTIRLANSNKYIKGEKYAITLQVSKNKEPLPKGVATIAEIKPFKLEALNEFMARIDTGYSTDNAKDVIIRMYPKVDFRTALLYFILLVKEK